MPNSIHQTLHILRFDPQNSMRVGPVVEETEEGKERKGMRKLRPRGYGGLSR